MMKNNRFTKLSQKKESDSSSRFYSLNKEEKYYNQTSKKKSISSKIRSAILIFFTFLVFLFLLIASIIYIYHNNKYLRNFLQKISPEENNPANLELQPHLEKRNFLTPDTNSIQNEQLREAMYLYERGYLQTAKSILAELLENSTDQFILSYVNLYSGVIAEHQNLSQVAITYYKRAIEKQNSNYYAHYNLAYLYYLNHNLEKAYEHIHQASMFAPQDPDVHIFKSIIEKKLHKHRLSKETLEKVIPHDNSLKSKYSLGLLYKEEGEILEAKSIFLNIINENTHGEFVAKSSAQLASILVEQGSFDDALFYLQKSVALSPKESTYRYNLALIQYKLGNYQDALSNLKQASLLGNKTVEIYLYIAELYDSLKRSFEAEKILKEAQRTYPNNTQILLYLGKIQLQNNNWDTALQTYKQLFFSSSNTSTKQISAYYLGLIYSEFDNFNEAKKYFELSIDLEPFHQESIIALGSLYTTYNQPDKTISLYLNTLKQFPDAKEVIKAQSKHYISIGFFEEAEVTLKDLLSHPNKNSQDTSFAHYSLGKLFHQKKKYSVAIEHYQEALKSQTPYEKHTLLISLASSLLDNKSSPKIALSYLNQALSMKPNDDLTKLWVSKALYTEHTYESKQQAEKELTSIIHNSHSSNILVGAHLLRGNIYYEDQAYVKALYDFNSVLEHDPSNDNAFRNRKATLNKLER